MKTPKYIIVKLMGLEVPIVFAEVIPHNWFADSYPQNKIISAGQCRFITQSNDGLESFEGLLDDKTRVEVECFGCSTSLKKASRPQDARIIQRSFFQ